MSDVVSGYIDLQYSLHCGLLSHSRQRIILVHVWVVVCGLRGCGLQDCIMSVCCEDVLFLSYLNITSR